MGFATFMHMSFRVAQKALDSLLTEVQAYLDFCSALSLSGPCQCATCCGPCGTKADDVECGTRHSSMLSSV